MTHEPPQLTADDLARYEWQMWTHGFGESGQRKLKGASVLISRCGGVGGVVAMELAAAGVGKLVIAHGGNLRPSDLNRQLLMVHEYLEKPRTQSIERRLSEFNPLIEVEAVSENISESNVASLISKVDIVVDCAPLFEERYLMNAESIRQNKPLVECAMNDMEAYITTIIPGKTPCLSCLFPEKSPTWKRQFPVFGAVAGSVGCLGAMEVIKLISGFGKTLAGNLLTYDLKTMVFRKLNIRRNENCLICGSK